MNKTEKKPMSDLKPCPRRCVASPRIYSIAPFINDEWKAYVHCRWGNCFVGPTRTAATKEEAERLATDAWNTRPASVPVEALRKLDERFDFTNPGATWRRLRELIDQAERREGS